MKRKNLEKAKDVGEICLALYEIHRHTYNSLSKINRVHYPHRTNLEDSELLGELKDILQYIQGRIFDLIKEVE